MKRVWVGFGVLAAAIVAGGASRIRAVPQQGDRGALRLAGHVITAEQNPVRRARVRISGPTAIDTDTDTDGNFGASGLAAGSYRVSIVKSGFVQLAPATIDIQAPSETLTITMQRGAVITGRVLYESGLPAADAAVSLSESPSVPPTLIKTDDRGVFRFHTLKPGEYILRAPGVYYPNAPDESQAQPLRVAVGEMTDVQLVMPAAAAAFNAPERPTLSADEMAKGAGIITGRIIDAETHAPIEGAMVVAALKTATPIRHVRSADDGTFVLDKLPAGSYQIAATAFGYARSVYGQRATADPWVMVTVKEAERRSDVTLALAPVRTLVGRVLDEFGDPAPDLRVQVFRTNGNGSAGRLPAPADVRTDDTGAFRVPRLDPGSYLLLAYGGPLARESDNAPDDFARGFAPTFFPGTTSATAALPVQIEVEKSPLPVALGMIPAPLTGIDVRVTDADGTPANAYVALIPLHEGQIRVPITMRAEPRAEGQFAISNISSGTYAVQAVGVGTDPGVRGYSSAVVTTGATDRARVDLRLVPARTLRGRLLADERLSFDLIRFTRVLTTPVDFMRGAAVANNNAVNQDGTFAIDSFFGEVRLSVTLPDPWVVIRITAQGRDITDEIINSADGDLPEVVVRIARGGRIVGKVTDRDGRVTPAFVMAFPEDDRVANVSRYVRLTEVDQKGEFELSQLVSGPFRVVALDGPIGALSGENLKTLRGHGTRVSIQLGATVPVALMIGR